MLPTLYQAMSMAIEQTPAVSTIGILMTASGVGIATGSATDIFGFTVDEWRVIGVITGIVIGVIGLSIQLVTAVINYRKGRM